MANEPEANGCITTNGLAEKFGSGEALKFAKKLYIHGGNISNWNRIKRKTMPSSADEVSVASVALLKLRYVVYRWKRDDVVILSY